MTDAESISNPENENVRQVRRAVIDVQSIECLRSGSRFLLLCRTGKADV